MMLQIHWCQQLTCENMQVALGFRCLFNTFSHFIEQNKNNNKINWRYKVINRVSSPVCAVKVIQVQITVTMMSVC